MDPITLLKDGGPFMYVLLAGVFAGGFGAVVLWVLSLVPLRVPAFLWTVVPAGLVAAGATGGLLGLEELAAALEQASPDMTSVLTAVGTSIALLPSLSGHTLAGAFLLGSAALLGVALVARPGPEAALTPAHAAPGALAGLVGGVAGLALGGLGAGLYALVGGGALALASLRMAAEGAHAERVAAGRGAVGWLAVLALLCQAQSRAESGLSMRLAAVAHASSSSRQELIDAIDATASFDPTGSLVAAALVGLAAAAAAGLAGPRIARPGALAGAVVALLVVAGPAALVAQESVAVAANVPLTVPFGVRRLAVLDAAGLSLPVSSVDQPAWDGPSLRLPASGQGVLDEAGEGPLRIEADRSVTVSTLARALAAAGGERFADARLAVRGVGEGVSAIDVRFDAPPYAAAEVVFDHPPLGLGIAGAPGAWEIGTEGTTVAAGDLAAVRDILGRVKDVYPDEDEVRVRPAGAVTLAELVALLDAARGEPERPLFPNVTVELP